MALPTFTPGTQIRAQEMNDALATLFDMVYPVGSIYMSASLSTAAAVNNTLPGTWQAWGAGRVPVGVDTTDSDFDTAEETGGEKTHQLTVAEMPKHSHGVDLYLGWQTGGGVSVGRVVENNGNMNGWGCNIKNSGGDGAHNNLQPYITCYMYKRIS